MPAEEEIHRVFAEKLILKKGKICTVCAHRERAAIDLALARGVAVSALARRYDLGTDSIYRHRRGHVAEECGDSNMVCRVTGQLHQNLELTGKLLGDLGVGSTTVNNVLVMPAYVEMRSALVNALADFPEARQPLQRCCISLRQEWPRTSRPKRSGLSDINLFRYCNRVINLDIQISSSALDPGVTEQ